MNQYLFSFQAHPDHSATLQYHPEPKKGKRHNSRRFGEKDHIGFQLHGLSKSDPITTLVIAFNNNGGSGTPSPFAGGTSTFTWKPGEAPATIGVSTGDWGFSATLTSQSGQVFILPDPELEVGD